MSSQDLPREKLKKYGVTKLHDFELLALLLGAGVKGVNVLNLSKTILRKVNEIGKEKIVIEDLLKIKGLGRAKASQILAVIEIGKRLYGEVPEILSPQDVWNLCLDIRASKKEHLVAFYLNTQNRIIGRELISVGTLDESMVHPREVFEPAVKLSAASIILSHNHPSGDSRPSEADNEVTVRLKTAASIMGIAISDHVIVADSGYFSFKEKGMLL